MNEDEKDKQKRIVSEIRWLNFQKKKKNMIRYCVGLTCVTYLIRGVNVSMWVSQETKKKKSCANFLLHCKYCFQIVCT